MTLRTAPAGRLPRRRPSGFLPPSTFEAALGELSARRATGALEGAAGSVYLEDGAVVHAESPFAPDTEALLTGGGQHRSGPRAETGERELCQLTALLDAAFFALPQHHVPLAFRSGRRPQSTTACPLPADSLRRAVGRRRALLDKVWPRSEIDTAAVTRRPQLPHGTRKSPVRTAGQRAVLAAADGHRTPSQIARLLGRSAFATLLDIRQLAADGLIETPSRPAVPAPAPAPPVPDTPAAGRSPGLPPQTEPLYDPSDPEVALLLRIRAALEARL